jgi:predicted nucleic acid-binding protein
MGVFLDTSFFLGLCHPKDPNHKASVRLFRGMATGNQGLLYTSTYVIAETATIILVRTANDPRLIEKFYGMVEGAAPFARIIDIDKNGLIDVWALFKAHNKNAKAKNEYLSFVDASNIVLCRRNDIQRIASFDGDFEPYIQRIE